jgi:hypothetical protein
MGRGIRLQLSLTVGDRKRIEALLSGGVQQVRTVIRALALGSWLHEAEIEIGLFSRQCLGKRRISAIQHLRAETIAWNQLTDRNQTTIEWKFTRKKARLKLKYTMMRS